MVFFPDKTMIYILAVLVALFCSATSSKPPVVTVPNLGNIEGTIFKSLYGRDFYAFEGVPFAEPPVGDRRFEAPVEKKPWNGTWKANTIYKCMQYVIEEEPVVGDEDCLYLNLYTPNLDQKANLDVIVFIHGGAFMFLYGGLFGPKYLLDKNVVYVNLNYRLGPLGFLSTEDNVVPGNNGIWDQIQALIWIQKHIKYFGGNPNSVTLTGMSAGGASTHIHYLSPKSKNLFHRGMSQSGTALNPWVLMEQALEKTKFLASGLGCFSSDNKKMISCLKKRPGRQIVSFVKNFLPWLYNPFSPFGVVVDSWSFDPILPNHPYTLIKNQNFTDKPWIVSHTNFEGLYPSTDFLQEKYLDYIDSNWNETVPFIMDYNYTVTPNLRDETSQKIRDYYLGKQKLNMGTFLNFTHMLSHRLFTIDIQKAARMQANLMLSPIYFYHFSYRGAYAWYENYAKRREDFGAAHAEDTTYLFSLSGVDTASTESDRMIIQFFIDMLASYAKTGVPEAPIKWVPLSKNLTDPIRALEIVSPDKIFMGSLKSETESFWESLPIMENDKLMT